MSLVGRLRRVASDPCEMIGCCGDSCKVFKRLAPWVFAEDDESTVICCGVCVVSVLVAL